MAKVFFVMSHSYGEESIIDFFKTEKEALKQGKSEYAEFEMDGQASAEDEDGYTYLGDALTFKKGILFTLEKKGPKVQAMEAEEAEEYALNLGGEDGSAVFFKGFTKGMYGSLGGTPNGDGHTWTYAGDGIELNESNTSSQHVPTFESFSSDFLQMQAEKSGMTREEWISHYGSSTAGVSEANADGTISDDEDDDLGNFLASVEFSTKELIDYIEKESQEIGGQFRAPGYKSQAIKLVKEIFRRKKMKI
jgi:hypothetical protein